MAKIAVKVNGLARVRAQFLGAGQKVAKGVLNILSKAKINKQDSQYQGDDLVTANIGSSKPFTLMAADLRGAYASYKEKLTKPGEALPLFVDDNGKPIGANAELGYINPKLNWEVDNGSLSIAI